MALLIVGLTGLGMLHGWTEGVGYHMRAYYTPLWLCAVLMCLLLVLVISLFLVFVCLYCNHPGIIKQHIVLLAVSWPVAVFLIVSAVVTSAPALVGLLLILYFTALLPFAHLYNNVEWTASVDPPV
ncbi:hypothetical protein Y032_0130g1544 [Ancylostoma ceylanicum]|uniref:Uncharacterized protein n=1 Tax=Ancylostoma ceylanicum TaxID=53326 RepID=A0A016T7G7_9BILA|nr:hypothetical protein Y032_0130g1544 [Ancylostoma ceylanicum]